MGDLIFAIFVTLVTVMIISYSNGIDKNCFRAFVQSKTVVLYYYFCGITNQFLVANTVTFPRNYVDKSKSNSLWWFYTYQTVWIHDCIITCISDTSKLLWWTTILVVLHVKVNSLSPMVIIKEQSTMCFNETWHLHFMLPINKIT